VTETEDLEALSQMRILRHYWQGRADHYKSMFITMTIISCVGWFFALAQAIGWWP
jgi:hypothetical protein